MAKLRLQPILGAAIAGLFFLVACGGDPQPPADTAAPTVAITDSVPGATATGDVVFTFTFSEPVTTSFTAASIGVSGATKGAFTRVSETVSTLVAKPSALSGTATVTVAKGAFRDLAGNASLAVATASQAYEIPDTAAPTVVITDDVPGATATGDVVFTFTFSEPITEAFTADAITVDGAPKGAFARVSPTVSTLVVSPIAGTSGVITVTVPVGGFSDMAGNASTLAANASQAFDRAAPDTTAPTVVISNRVSAATGEALFTFTFSEPVTPAFTVESIAVDGAPKGIFTRVSSTVSTLSVMPVTGTSGTIAVTVPAGAFSDAAGNLSAAAASASQAFALPSSFTLLWSDEFNAPGPLDTAKWRFETGLNWYNGELQAYTDSLKNARVEDGSMVIEAINEAYQTKNYTSARVNSKGSWTYGRMEIKALLPQGSKLWPAIWMMPDASPYGGWPNSGEIDIMENWSWAENTIYGTVHTQDYNHIAGTQKGGNIVVSDPSANWHVYILEWYEDQARWYVDDKNYFTFYNEGVNSKWPFNHPFHFIFNTAVESGAIASDPTWTKRTMEIDYVRVYSGPTTGPVPPVVDLPGRVEAENFTKMVGVAMEACTDIGGTQDVGWSDPGDWMEYKVNVTAAGTYTIRFRVAGQTATGQINCLVDGVQALNVSFPPTGAWQTWATVEKSITLTPGEHTLRIATVTGGYNINWFEVVAP